MSEQVVQKEMSSHLRVMPAAGILAMLCFMYQASAQTPGASTIEPLQQRRNAIIQDIWTNGFVCLKPEYRPPLQSVQSSFATPEAVRGRMVTEQQILTDSQKALKVSQIADSHWRFLGKALDMMMGALINAGTGHGGKVLAAERVFSAQGFIDQANDMIACTTFRQQKLRELAEIDELIRRQGKPLRFPSRPEAEKTKNSPYAF